MRDKERERCIKSERESLYERARAKAREERAIGRREIEREREREKDTSRRLAFKRKALRVIPRGKHG